MDKVRKLGSLDDWHEMLDEKDSLAVVNVFDYPSNSPLGPRVYRPLSKACPETSFYQFNVSDNMDVANEMSIGKLPAFYFYRNGERVKELGGNVGFFELCDEIEGIESEG